VTAFEIAFWVVTTVLGVGGLVWAVYLRRLELRALSQSERLLGGGQR